MRNDIAGPETESTTAMWEGLEGVVREKAQEFIQQILEEEVTELLGREKSERKAAVDAAPGYRNGYGKARRLSMSSGTITVRRPRVRGLEERFESRVLPLFARRTAFLPERRVMMQAWADYLDRLRAGEQIEPEAHGTGAIHMPTALGIRSVNWGLAVPGS